MNSGSSLVTHVALAEKHLRNARQAWENSVATGSSGCAEELELAIAHIKDVQSAAFGAPADVKQRLEEFRGHLRSFAILIDSAMAFHRGLALHTGIEQPVSMEA